MPRQNQDHGSYVRGVTSVTPIQKGGTGADTAVGAVDNLKGLHRSTIDQANGLAMVDNSGLLKTEYFRNLDIFIGPRLKGPAALYKGCSARFQVMNFASELTVQVEIKNYDKHDFGYKAQGPNFSFNIPASFSDTSLTIVIIYDGITREVTLPIETPAIRKPAIITADSSVFSSVAWIEVAPPRYIGMSEFDEYIASSPQSYRGNTSTISGDNVTIQEYFSYSGIGQLCAKYPTAEIRVAGRLKSDTGIAYVVINDVKWPLTKVYNETTFRFLSSLKVDFVTSPGEEIWIGFIRPVGGNKSTNAALKTLALVEATPALDSTWSQIAAIDINELNGSLMLPLTGMANGKRYIRFRYHYQYSGGELFSEYSDPISLTVDSNSQPNVTTIASPYVSGVVGFGRAVCYGETTNGAIVNNIQELFTTGEFINGKAAVFHYSLPYNVMSAIPKYEATISLPYEPTRSASEGFGKRIILSEDGRYLFISAPDASYSDIAGTTGAVYIYERIGGRFVFIRRLMDSRRLAYRFGTSIAQVGNVLLVGTGSSVTQVPEVHVIAIYDPVTNADFVFKNNYTNGIAGEVNWGSISVGRKFDTAVASIPVIISGAKKDPGTGFVKQVSHLCTLNPVAYTISPKSDLFDAGQVSLFGTDISDDRFAMTYRGFSESDGLHTGFLYRLDNETRKLLSYKWKYSPDGLTFTLETTGADINNYTLPGSGAAIGGLSIANDSSKIFVGSSQDNVVVQTADGPVTYVSAGLLYQIRLTSNL